MLIVAARPAEVSEQDVRQLGSTASKAWAEVGLDVCCEAIESDSDQIKRLGFIEDWRRLA
jgi:hypothetical protein